MQRLKEPTRICKLCFKDFEISSLRALVNKNIHVCDRCFDEFEPKFIPFTIEGYKGIAIYEYDERMRKLIYQFKGCYDIELGEIFLEQYIRMIKLRYKGYYVVHIPSYEIDDIRREFNHVKEAFKALNLPILDLISKIDEYKQSDQKAVDRPNIIKHLKVSDLEKVKNKKLLIVDDVVTTGSTLKSSIELLKKGMPKDIKILTIAKVIH